MAADSSERFVLLNHLGEEFAERFRRGERPSLQEYIDRHPELADGIREFFPAMVEMEQIKQAREEINEPPAACPLPTLERLGDYRIIREIGRGGMGVVYEAEQVSLGRHVALKVLPRQLLVDARTRHRFEREARSAARLHHTNIVPVFGVGEHDGLPYYVMQFIQGLGLDEVLEELKRMQLGADRGRGGLRRSGELKVAPRQVSVAGGWRDVTAADMARSLLTGRIEPSEDEGEATVAVPQPDEATEPAPGPTVGVAAVAAAPSAVAGRLSDSFSLSSSSVMRAGSGSRPGKRRLSYWQRVAEIGVQVADALQHAHGQGVLHRDIKPSNLLLDTGGVVWVTDFGLAKADDQRNLTHTGDILGTLRYMSPEAFDGRTDPRSDVYSLGLTLYELLGLRPAFDEKERNRLIKQVTTGEPARLDRLNPEVPRDLVTIVHKAIERDPAHRYATSGELMADLQRFVDDEPILARRQTQWERCSRWARRNPAIAWMGGILTAVLVVATVVSVFVAARMTKLARSEANAADDERIARAEADRAKEREAGERERAEAAQKAAENNRARAMEALGKAEENFAKARAAVNEYLTAVSDDPRLKAPGLSPLRAQLLQSALGFYQQFLREHGSDPTLRKELAAAYNKVGRIFWDVGQRPLATQSFSQAQRLYEDLAALAPLDPEVQDGLAQALFRQLGYDRAIAIWEKLIRPDDPRYHADLAWAYSEAARACLDRQDWPRHLELLRKALAIRERLVRIRPDDWQAHQGLAASLYNIGEAMEGKDRGAEQLALWRRALAEMETAYRLQPGDPTTLLVLVSQLRKLAELAGRMGAVDLALAAHRREVEVLDHRARDNPGVAGFDADLVGGHARLLECLRSAGRLDEAAKVADRARERIAETTEETTEYFGNVSHLSLLVHSLALARVRASGGAVNAEREAEAAVNDLRRHVLAGWYRGAEWMRTDPRTEPLRRRADFKDLLARMDELDPADAAVNNPNATPEERLAARRTIPLRGLARGSLARAAPARPAAFSAATWLGPGRTWARDCSPPAGSTRRGPSSTRRWPSGSRSWPKPRPTTRFEPIWPKAGFQPVTCSPPWDASRRRARSGKRA